jgi:hypothetical protein
MAQTDPQIPVHTPEEGYDHHDARAGLVAGIAGGTVALLVVFILGVYWLYVTWFTDVEQAQYTGVASKELLAIRDREEEHLHKYGYIDKEKGIVRVPIERALEIVASDYQQGKVFYNTQAYPVKEEPLGGAAGGTSPAPSAQAAAPAQTTNPTHATTTAQ